MGTSDTMLAPRGWWAKTPMTVVQFFSIAPEDISKHCCTCRVSSACPRYSSLATSVTEMLQELCSWRKWYLYPACCSSLVSLIKSQTKSEGHWWDTGDHKPSLHIFMSSSLELGEQWDMHNSKRVEGRRKKKKQSIPSSKILIWCQLAISARQKRQNGGGGEGHNNLL